MALSKSELGSGPIDPFSPNYEIFNKIKNSNLGPNKKVTFFGEDELGGFCDLSIFEIGEIKRTKKISKNYIIDDGDGIPKFSKNGSSISKIEKKFLPRKSPPFAMFLTGFVNRQETSVTENYQNESMDRVSNTTVIDMITDKILNRELAIFYAQKRAVAQLQSGDVDRAFIEKNFKEELASIESWVDNIPKGLLQKGYFFYKTEVLLLQPNELIVSVYDRSLIFSREGGEFEIANILEVVNLINDYQNLLGCHVNETIHFWEKKL